MSLEFPVSYKYEVPPPAGQIIVPPAGVIALHGETLWEVPVQHVLLESALDAKLQLLKGAANNTAKQIRVP